MAPTDNDSSQPLSSGASTSVNDSASSAIKSISGDENADARQKLDDVYQSIASSDNPINSTVQSITDSAASNTSPTGALGNAVSSVTGALGLSKDPSQSDPNSNPLSDAVSSITGALGIGGDDSEASKQGAAIGERVGADTRHGAASGIATAVYGKPVSQKQEERRQEMPLGDNEQHAKDSTVVGYLGGTLGGVTRTVGGTLGAAGTGLGQTTTSVSGGGPPGSEQKSENEDDEIEEEEAEEEEEGGVEADGRNPEKSERKKKKKEKNWGQRGGGAIQTGGNAITSGTDTAARALENTSKGYPIQWQEVSGDKRLA